MREKALVEMLLVRSVEESLPDFFGPETLLKAVSEAGSIENKQEWLRKRAEYLFTRIPEGWKGILSMTQPPIKLLVALTIVAFLIGFYSNFLGPSDYFHIIYNPIVILSLWNILVFVGFVFAMVRKFKDSPRTPKTNSQGILPQETGPGGTGDVSNLPSGKPQQGRTGMLHKLLLILISYRVQKTTPGILYRLLSSLWLSWNKFMMRFQKNNELLSSCPPILIRFWNYYLHLCSPLVFARLWSAVHILSIGLILGALSGVYTRGLFHEYTVVWRSSFVNEPETVRLILNVFLGLPTYTLSGHFISSSSVSVLTSAKGSPAAFWIHVLSLTSFLFVIVPRTILFSADQVYAKAKSLFLKVDITEEYYRNIIHTMVELKMKHLREKLEPIVIGEISQFSGAIAAYIREKFYDKTVVSMLMEFRNNGGRIADLENNVKRALEDFNTEELNQYIVLAQNDYRRSLSNHIVRIVGQDLAGPNAADVNQLDWGGNSIGNGLAQEFIAGISFAVTAAVSSSLVIAATIMKSLHVVIVASILHGPIGWLIGAVLGLFLVSGFYAHKSDKIQDFIKGIKLPSLITKKVLTEKKISEVVEEGRRITCEEVKRAVEKQLTPSASAVADKILEEMRKLYLSDAATIP